METLPIDGVRPGAVLAVAVKDARGSVLIQEGKVLTEDWIKRLKGRGIASVKVREAGEAAPAVPGAAVPAPPPKPEDHRLERLDRMFARAPQEPLMLALQEAARQAISERSP